LNPPLAPADLPEWISWVGQDANGWWWGFEHEPNPGDSGWYENEVGRYRKLAESHPPPEWRDTLRRVR